MAFYSRRYRWLSWCLRYLRGRDILQIGMLVAAGVLAVNTFSFKPLVSAVAGSVYGALLFVFAIITIGRRNATDYAEGEVLWGLFSHMNKEIFADNNRTRFTLFKQAPFRPNYIIPWYRFQKGATDAIEEATKSRSRYTREDGLTGEAWANAGREISVSLLPKFRTRQEFETYHIDELGIDPAIVRDLSPFMQHIRTIISYGFADSRGKFLGVLSLDLQFPLTSEGSAVFGDLDSENEAEEEAVAVNELGANSMALIVRSIQSVLESFASIEKVRKYAGE